MDAIEGSLMEHPETYRSESIRLEGSNLVVPGDPDWDHRRERGSPQLLREFIALRDQGPVEICGFANKHGLLGLCRCGLPFAHEPECEPNQSDDGRFYVEPVQRWQKIARMAYAITALRQELPESRGSPKHWRTLDTPPLGNPETALWTVVGDWVSAADVRLNIGGYDGEPQLQGRWLFGTLALELLQAVRTRRLAVCSGCTRVYWRRREPKRGQKNWCPICNDEGVRSRHAKRGLRRRAPETDIIRDP